jgi:glycosyltransferase involved in cell wall biosynthesis
MVPRLGKGIMRVVLVANHVSEVRRSMRRFLALLEEELPALGATVEVMAPASSRLSSRLPPRARALTDKLAFQARLARNTADVVHVIDQGDAGYVGFAGRARSVVTCHDVSVLDDTAFLGRPFTAGWAYRQLLLARMRKGLCRADALVCDSEYTLADVGRLLPDREKQRRLRVYLPLRFDPPGNAPVALPAELSDPSRPFVLHVGSGGHRKNRLRLLEVLARLDPRFLLALAGDPPEPPFRAHAAKLGLATRVVSVARPSDGLLATLYSRAHCLLFPSTFEGFGWPVLEAQACDCPVVASNVTSLPEVAGAGALLAAPDDTGALARHVEALLDPECRREIVANGRENAQRFRRIEIGREYASVYEEVVRAGTTVSR